MLNSGPGAYDAQHANFPDLRGKRPLDGAGHWVQEEKPEEVTRAIVEFLTSVRD